MVIQNIELDNNKEKVNFKSDGDFALSYDELLEDICGVRCKIQ